MTSENEKKLVEKLSAIHDALERIVDALNGLVYQSFVEDEDKTEFYGEDE